jgi:hypothetical protein
MIAIPHVRLREGFAAPALNCAMMTRSRLNRRQQGYDADEHR